MYIKMCKIVFGCFLYYYSVDVPLQCDILVPTIMSNKFEDDIFGEGMLMLTSLHTNTQSIIQEYKSSKFDIGYAFGICYTKCQKYI